MPYIETNKVSYRTLVLELTLESQSIANNTSTVYWKLRGGSGGGDSGHWVNTGPVECTVGDRYQYKPERVSMYDGTMMLDGRATFTHDAAGNLSIGYACKGTIYYTGTYNVSASSSWALPNIPRYATLSSHTNKATWNNIAVTWATAEDCSNIKIQSGSSIAAPGTVWVNRAINGKTATENMAMAEVTKRDYYIVLKRKDSGLEKIFGPYSATTPRRVPVLTASLASVTLNSCVINWSSDLPMQNSHIYRNGAHYQTVTFSNLTSGQITVTGLTPGTNCSIQIPMWRNGLTNETAYWPPAVSVTTTGLPVITGPDFNDENNPTITYTNPAGNNVTTLQACIAKSDGSVIYAQYRDINKTGTLSYQFVLTDAERKALRDATPNSKTMVFKWYIRSVVNGVTHYSTQDKTLTIVNDKPTFIASPASLLANFNDGGNSKESYNVLLGNPTVPTIVQLLGKLRVTVNANSSTAIKSATNSKLVYKIQNASNTKVVNDTEYNYNAAAHTIDIDTRNLAAGSYTFYIWSKNSRGTVSDEKLIAFNVVKYAAPTIIAEMLRYLCFEQKVSLSLTAISSKTSINSVRKNTVAAIEYRYGQVGNALGSWKDIKSTATLATKQDIQDSEILIRNVAAEDGFDSLVLDSSKSFNFEFQIRDAIGMTSQVFKLTIAAGIPIFGIFDSGHIVAGKVPELSAANPMLQVGGDGQFNINGSLVRISKLKSDLSSITRNEGNNHTNLDGRFNVNTVGGLRYRHPTGGSFFVWNDGNNTHFMHTNANDPDGTYNANRPIYINNASGAVVLTDNTTTTTKASSDSSTKLATTAYVKGQFDLKTDANSGLRRGNSFGTPLTAGLAYLYGMQTGWDTSGHIAMADAQKFINSWDGGVEMANGSCRIRIGRFVIVARTWVGSVANNIAWNGGFASNPIVLGAHGVTFAAQPVFLIVGGSQYADHILYQDAGSLTDWPRFLIATHGGAVTANMRVNLFAIGRDR